MTSTIRTVLSITAILLAALPVKAQGQEPPTLLVPQGSAISLDGELREYEWEGAARVSLSDAGEAFFTSHQDLLNIGIRGPDFGLAHVALASADTIWVLHASAALGSIVYIREGAEWLKVQDPTWEVRNPSLSPEAISQREAYLEAHHWVGTTGHMGVEREIEFLIRRDRFGGEELRLAVVFFPMGPPGAIPHWPDTVQDGAVEPELLAGPMPQRLPFHPETWGRIRVGR